MMKRLITALLTALMIPVMPAAAAEMPVQENAYERNVTILNRFGIVDDVYKNLNGEHSVITDGIVNQTIYNFNGYNTGSTESYADITVGEAAAKLLYAMGLGYMYEAFGTDSVSYYRAARQCGLLNGIYADANCALESAVFAKMLINAMSVEQKTGVKTGDKAEYISVGNYMDMHNIKKLSGTVEATSDTSVNMPNGVKSGQTVIDGITYETNMNARPYLGYKVEYYTQDNSNGKFDKIMCMFVKGENSVITVDAEDINSVSGDMTKFSYNVEDDKVKSEKIKKDFVLIYNGKYKLKKEAALLKPALGNVTLLDNDGDGTTDIVFVNAYEIYIINNVSDDVIYDQNGKKELDLSSSKNIRGIYKNGEEADIASLTRDDVAYVAVDASGKYIEINASDEKITGKVNSVEDTGNYRTYTIDGKEYSASINLNIDNLLGSDGTFYLGPTGIIEKQIIEKNGSYGILISAANENGIGNKKVKIFTSNGEEQIFDIADSAYLYDGTRKKIGEAEMARLSEYAYIYKNPPAGIEAKYAMAPMIMYSVDSEGKIKTISLPKLYTEEEAGENRGKYTLQSTATKENMLYRRSYTEYSAYNRGFNPAPDTSNSDSMAKFANISTIIFEVPVENDGTISSDYSKKINVYNGNHSYSRRIWANFYNADENRNAAAVVVYKENANTDYIYGMLIESSTITLNEDGDECITLNGYMDGQKVSLRVSDNVAISTERLSLAMRSVPQVTAKTLGKGDFIYMAQNSKGEIMYIEPQLLGGYANEDYVRFHNAITTVDYAEVVFGEVIAVNSSLLTLKLDTNLHNSEELIFYVNNYGNAIKGFYDSKEHKVKGKTSSISVGDYVLIMRDSSRIMSMLVRK